MSPVDALHRAAYRLAFRALRLWWLVRRPTLTGAAVALWHEGRLLVVRTSYHHWLDLPGGGVGRNEPPVVAAARELREETAIAVAPEALAPEGVFRYRDRYRSMTAHVFAWRPGVAPPPVRVDRREVVWAGFLDPAELAAGGEASPLLRAYLKARAGAAGGG